MIGQTRALAPPQRRQRLLVGTDCALAGAGAARLDLGEHERAPVAGDHVDLALARADVAREYAEAEPLHVHGGEPLVEATELAPRLASRSGVVLGWGGPVGGQGATTLRIAWESARPAGEGADMRLARAPAPK